MIFLFFLMSFGLVLEAPAKPLRIVLDPGHGGSDQGTRMGTLSESGLTLEIGLKLASQLRKKGYWVGLTRERDRDLRLRDRIQFANQAKADLFLSLHINAGTLGSKTQPSGFETFVLSAEGLRSSQRLALFRDLPAPSHLEAKGLDVASRNILRDHQLDQNREPSRLLASFLQQELEKLTPHQARRGVKEGLFFVLLGTDMPSVLLELGFLEHPQDRARLLEAEGQGRMLEAIVKGLELFIKRAVKKS
jgi:N-acetylmuramoyl-L-alanine amidase